MNCRHCGYELIVLRDGKTKCLKCLLAKKERLEEEKKKKRKK